MKRNYSPELVRKLQGTVQIEYTLAKRGSENLRKLFSTQPYVASFGAYNGQQAVQQIKEVV